MVVMTIPDWRENKWIRYMLRSHLPKEAVPIEVTRRDQPASGAQEATKYAVVVYTMGEKIYRAELKLRNDSHWYKCRGKECVNEQRES